LQRCSCIGAVACGGRLVSLGQLERSQTFIKVLLVSAGLTRHASVDHITAMTAAEESRDLHHRRKAAVVPDGVLNRGSLVD
jgi:hypothetical protein